MIKNSALLFVFVSVIIFSCQKEVNWNIDTGGTTGGGSTGGGTSGSTLVRTVSKETVDSAVTVYSYDAGKRLSNIKITGKSRGVDVGNEERIYRNAAGIIIRKTQINSQLSAAGLDSAVTIIYYNATTSRYTARVSGISMFGFSVNDSTALIYDAAGKVIEEDVYQAIPLLGQAYEMSLKTKYTYSASGNLIQTDTYSHDVTAGTDVLQSVTKYMFDSKVAAIMLNNDACAIGHEDLVSVNNAIKIDISSPTTPAAATTVIFTYNYFSNSRPSTGTSTLTPGSVSTNLVYFYQ